MPELYIGLMSGTSMDGIDAALVDFKDNQIRLVDSYSHSIPKSLKEKLKLLSLDAPEASIDMLGEADTELGLVFAEAVNLLISKAGITSKQVIAIGSHGQTIRHQPNIKNSFSLQIGDANRISYTTGITTVADFRRKDMAADGEGAPLAPAFHQQVFHSDSENRAILNIGGISNITFLPADSNQPSFGFDTGPGNILMDAWIHKHKNKNFDADGQWASSTDADTNLARLLMQDSFISSPPPKSTGREHYNLDWLQHQLDQTPQLKPDLVQATLNQFTRDSIAYAISNHLPDISRLIICGGGAHNHYLISQLSAQLTGIKVETSDTHGIHPDWVEAIAFAWLARQTINKIPGNMPSVTGAKQAVILGAVYPA